jgi:hypothetical protein
MVAPRRLDMMRPMRGAVLLIALLPVLAGCRGGGRGREDARDKDSGIGGGVAPADAGRVDDEPPSPVPTTTPVSPPIGNVVAGCTPVQKALDMWTLARAAYASLLDTAVREGWDWAGYNREVAQRAGAQLPSTGVGTGRGDDLPTPSTNLCRCDTAGLPELCAAYKRRGYPDVLCEASKAHEAVHVAHCEANRRLPAGSAARWPCNARDEATVPLAKRVEMELEAYDANLRLVRAWYVANQCPLPALPNDACALVSEGDASAVLGRSIESISHDRLGMYTVCTYFGAGSTAPATSISGMRMSSVAVSVLQTRLTRQQFEQQVVAENSATTGLPAQPLASVGDSAYMLGGDANSATVLAFKNGVVVTVIAWVQRSDAGDLREPVTTLAQSAVGRL